MKSRISAAGLIVGALLGVIAGAFLGSWILWLGLGVAIGLAAGAVTRRGAGASRGQLRERQEARL